jgi:hypothetical protein
VLDSSCSETDDDGNSLNIVGLLKNKNPNIQKKFK